TLLKGESIRISGFGAFKSVKKMERMGRNPKTGEKIIIPPHEVIIFKPSKDFLKRLNIEN
ncbi:HU family DNA-binding protein, partial [bacterium]|nr:HU family DNA-binding protein [bacterium]